MLGGILCIAKIAASRLLMILFFVTIDYISFETKNGKSYSMSDFECEVSKFSEDSEQAIFGYKWRGIQILVFEEDGSERYATDEEVINILNNISEFTDFQIYCSDTGKEYFLGDSNIRPEIDDIHIYYVEDNKNKDIHLGGVK